jgi:thymidylate synthase
MSKVDSLYQEGLIEIMNGYEYEDPNREGVHRKEILNFTFSHDFSYGFPALSTKEVYFKGAIQELLFFLSGSTDIRDLWKKGVHFWDKDWAKFHGHNLAKVDLLKKHSKNQVYTNENYDMGRIYPAQYRAWTNLEEVGYNTYSKNNVDQIHNVLHKLRNNPLDTSMIVTAWNPAELDEMCLPPCHYGFQIVGRPLTLDEQVEWSHQNKVETTNKEVPKFGFEIHWQQRSTDFFLGTPINVMYYAAMAKLFEKITGHKALGIEGDLKKVHLYDNQWDVAKEQISRDTRKYGESELDIVVDNEELWLEDIDTILSNLTLENFVLKNYESYSKLAVPMLAYNKK